MKKSTYSMLKTSALIAAPLVLLATLGVGQQLTQSSARYQSSEVRDQSKACLDCHDEQRHTLAMTAHDFGDLSGTAGIGCIGCHDGSQLHMEDPSANNIGNPSRLVRHKQTELCARCHGNAHQTSMGQSDPHAVAGLNCSDCHQVHKDTLLPLNEQTAAEACGSCHQPILTQFARRSSHPIQTDQLQCVSCHDLSGTRDHLFSQGSEWSCQGCHAEQSGPFRHEHPVNGAHLVNGGGCIECHEPHGSANDRLLKQPGNMLCVQCHAVPPKHRTEHAGLGTKLACVDCHNAPHGSRDNSLLLDPDLGTRLFPNCYQSGCHDMVGEE